MNVKTLKKAMKEQGLSSKGVAVKCGLDRTTVFRLQNGEREPSLRVFKKLCKGLNISPVDLW